MEKYEYFSAPVTIHSDALSEFIESCGLTLKQFGWQCGLTGVCGARIYGDFELIYIIDGESILTINGEVYHGFAGDLVVIPKYTHCKIDTNPENPHENYWMHIDIGDIVAEEHLKNLLGGPLVHLRKDKLLLQYFRWLDAFQALGGEGSYLCAQSYLRLILIRMIQLVHDLDNCGEMSVKLWNAENCNHKLLGECIRTINERKGVITVGELADTLYVSPMYIRRLFRDVLGKTPLSFIRSVRIKEAEILLLTTNEAISAISIRLGFASPYHFSNEFRKFHAMSPSRFRALYLQRQ